MAKIVEFRQIDVGVDVLSLKLDMTNSSGQFIAQGAGQTAISVETYQAIRLQAHSTGVIVEEEAVNTSGTLCVTVPALSARIGTLLTFLRAITEGLQIISEIT